MFTYLLTSQAYIIYIIYYLMHFIITIYSLLPGRAACKVLFMSAIYLLKVLTFQKQKVYQNADYFGGTGKQNTLGVLRT